LTTEDVLVAHESTAGLSVEEGVYPAIVTVVEPVSGEFGDQWKFIFALDDHPDEEAWAWATAKLGTRTKLFRWAGILLGHPLALGEQLTRSDLVGKRCQVVIKEQPDADGGSRRKVDDIMKEKSGVPRPLESAPPPTPAPASLKVDVVNEPTAPETCFCGAAVAAYSPTGEPLCAEHADDTEPEEVLDNPIIPVDEMKSQYDFQREAHKHFKIQTLAAGLKKAGFNAVIDVADWPIAWALLCEKMKEPA